MAFPHFSVSRLRQWLDRSNESDDHKELAFASIDAFQHAIASAAPSTESLRVITEAAMHSRSLTWDVGLQLLARLGEDSDEARACIAKLAESSKMEQRRRSIQYISDRYPRPFCVTLLSKLLSDRSAKVRGFAAYRMELLNLKELTPLLQDAIKLEGNDEARFELEFALGLLRDNYYQCENAGQYKLILRCDRQFPPYKVWPGQISGKPITRASVEEHGISIAFEEMRRSTGYQTYSEMRRPWYTGTDG
ncbi:hypothetical protein SAMN06265222_1453 [Neorhodopirellula lusitana]|uniref:HEAT repeat domain-containing protein n=1 Tax=Neorhodopirellula lusitana TaxID=445327 RepID=A0ABY1QV86_9BACT|nr:hypothetical protein [Neorhodopirellula lusitana]SMP80116.1 hypothetical protein SAMN06265222_1453 [Neorhodopirellula lusitana]